MNEEIRFIDLFSGIGGFRLGLERAGEICKHTELWVGDKERRFEQHTESGGRGEGRPSLGYRCVWSCDNNKYANQVYTKRFGEADHYSGDIRGVDPRTIPDFDLLCAGFPCQSFSVAGKGKGFQDTRGSLFFEISRITEAKRPQMLLLENVKGLLSNDRGQTFKTILQELGRIGYWAEWQVFNSKHHGVPQNRERVFIIGHSRNGSTRPVFPITESDGLPVKEPRKWEGITSPLDASYHKGTRRQRTFIASRIPLKFLGRNEKNWVKDEAYTVDSVNTGGVMLSNKSRYTGKYDGSIRSPIKKDGISWCLNKTPDAGVIIADRTRSYAGKGRNLESPKPFTNALSSVSKDNYLLKNAKIRRLTPTECERLQGFPDNWTEWGIDENGEKVKISDTQRYRALGNAVTTSVITFLGHKIMEALK